jgi:hypothetical protein
LIIAVYYYRRQKYVGTVECPELKKPSAAAVDDKGNFLIASQR